MECVTAYDIAIIGGGFTVVGALVGGIVTYWFTAHLEDRKMAQIARVEFRSAFAEIYTATSATSTADNRAIYSILLASRSNHDRVAKAFASHLGFWRRRSFAKAWKHYEKTRHSNPYSHGKIQSALQDILRFCE